MKCSVLQAAGPTLWEQGRERCPQEPCLLLADPSAPGPHRAGGAETVADPSKPPWGCAYSGCAAPAADSKPGLNPASQW